MARNKYDEEKTWSAGDDNHAQLLYRSLEQYNEEQKRTRRPSVLLGALIFLFLSSAGGIALAVVLMLQPVEIQAACIARDLILFAASLGLLYLCLHIRGARKDYRRRGPGPPQIYGEYLHASALIVERLGIAVWVAALVATAVMIAKAVPLGGLAGMAPYLNLAICIGAIPSFIIISACIESNPTPFATTGLSSSSFLTCRVSEFGDDLSAESSVSRRASLQRKESKSDSILTVPTAEIFKLGNSQPAAAPAKNPDHLTITTKDLPDDRTELMANSPVGASYNMPMVMNTMPLSPAPPMPNLPPSLSKSPPKPVYIPGGWKNEWNHVAEQVGVSKLPNGPTHNQNPGHTGQMSANSSESGGSSQSSGNRHRVTPSTSIASSAQRSRLSTVRYAAQPEIAVRQEIRVIRNPNYSPPAVLGGGGGGGKDAEREAAAAAAAAMIKPPEPVVVAGSAARAQDSTAATATATAATTELQPQPQPPTLKRQPSNFSRPLPPSRGSEADSGVEMRLPGLGDQEMPRR
ncbi:cytosolic Fe-S cluster assembly factor cfd1 [Hypoxylon texense]